MEKIISQQKEEIKKLYIENLADLLCVKTDNLKDDMS